MTNEYSPYSPKFKEGWGQLPSDLECKECTNFAGLSVDQPTTGRVAIWCEDPRRKSKLEIRPNEKASGGGIVMVGRCKTGKLSG